MSLFLSSQPPVSRLFGCSASRRQAPSLTEQGHRVFSFRPGLGSSSRRERAGYAQHFRQLQQQLALAERQLKEMRFQSCKCCANLWLPLA